MGPALLRAFLRFYAELNDHLPPDSRYRTLEKEFFVPGSVKDMIEGFGVPLTEVDLVLVNGETCDFSRIVQNGDRIAAYPVFESLDITPEVRLRERALRRPAFVLDAHLGKLAAYLRMLGFDAAYRSGASDTDLVRQSVAEKRTLLTRDRALLEHPSITHGYWLRETDSRLQAAEVVRRFDLSRLIQPFTRCMECNATLPRKAKEAIRTQPGLAAPQLLRSHLCAVSSFCSLPCCPHNRRLP